MDYGIDKIWKAGLVMQKETNHEREQRKRKFRHQDEEDDTISISEEAKECWASIANDESDKGN